MDAPNCSIVSPLNETDILTLHFHINQGKYTTDYIKTLQPDTPYAPAGIYTFRIQRTCDLVLEWIDEDWGAQYFFGDRCLGNCRDISRLPTTLMNNLYVKCKSPKIKIKCRLIPAKERDALLESYRDFIDTKNGLIFKNGVVSKFDPKAV